MSNIPDPSDTTRNNIENLIKSACEKYNLERPSNPAIIDQTKLVIRPLLQKMESKEFYQWFCPIWQNFEDLYSLEENETAWPELVGKIASALTERDSEDEEFRNPILCAMCVSYMLASLNSHVVAQSYALRMLLLFATRTELSQNVPFIHWLLNFMQHRIDNMIEIRDDKQRELFTSVCVGLFDSIPVFDSLCSRSILKFFGTSEFTQILYNNKDQKSHLESIATKTFNTTLSDDSFFVFETIHKTKLVYEFLTKDQQDLLKIFVSGGIGDFEAFVESHKDYIAKDNLDIETMRDKILVLSFVSLAHGKKSIGFPEAQKGLNLDKLSVKRLCVRINSTNAAKLSIDSVNEKIIIDYCQPRLMTDDVWGSMASRLQELAQSLVPE
ncbi:hypothetical protein TRFO_18696 [Tritrichomonas foetus]|uniref:Uncharacterized protein n=1 Tax=Tritrichomonas foetus TaxID=1144522 RepID=A0A1J4KKX9_9EUKA|nr:hypothetical protein TRFO_18696 [Tritrichomonas foetus]|eukprot:OHT11794.1 hypothetical protein TRFO_18696 [Tritrichomonas foetus]